MRLVCMSLQVHGIWNRYNMSCSITKATRQSVSRSAHATISKFAHDTVTVVTISKLHRELSSGNHLDTAYNPTYIHLQENSYITI
jgi:hypothetical protein